MQVLGYNQTAAGLGLAGATDLVAGAAPLLQCARNGFGHANAQLHAADVVMSRAISLQEPERHRERAYTRLATCKSGSHLQNSML